jgi:hypothetical protein
MATLAPAMANSILILIFAAMGRTACHPNSEFASMTMSACTVAGESVLMRKRQPKVNAAVLPLPDWCLFNQIPRRIGQK